MASLSPSSSLFQKHIALPQQHGSWALWLGPYLIGIGASKTFSPDLLWLTLASLGGFLLLQPLTILIKVIAKRRPKTDLAPALLWGISYSILALFGLTQLLITNYFFILWLALAALPVLVWQLLLIARREERGQMGIELVGSGVLALAAPAAYWINSGGINSTGWALWILCWLQSTGAVVYIYLRLEHRRMTELPNMGARFRLATRALLYNSVNILIVAILIATRDLTSFIIPPLTLFIFVIMLGEVIYGALIRPGIGAKPATIGVRQVIMTVIFAMLMIGVYKL